MTRAVIQGRDVDAAYENSLFSEHGVSLAGRLGGIFDIFEGTEQIQQLVISRSISGMRIQ